MSKLEQARRAIAAGFTQPVVRLLAGTSLTPNTVTWLGFLITVGAAALIVTGHIFAAGFVVLVAGLCDMLDGALARLTGRVARFGAILDSTLDRLSEAVVLLGLLWVYLRGGQVGAGLLVGFALLGSLLVSYLRARMEGVGIEGRVGLFTRPERVVVLVLGLLLSGLDYALITALAVITFFSYFTAVQRLVYAWRHTRA